MTYVGFRYLFTSLIFYNIGWLKNSLNLKDKLYRPTHLKTVPIETFSTLSVVLEMYALQMADIILVEAFTKISVAFTFALESYFIRESFNKARAIAITGIIIGSIGFIV